MLSSERMGISVSESESRRGRKFAEAKNTVVIIPAYNESRFIGSVVIQAKRYAAIVVVVDDGSKDGTAEIARSAGALRKMWNCPDPL